MPFVHDMASRVCAARPTVFDTIALRALPGVFAMRRSVLRHINLANQSFRPYDCFDARERSSWKDEAEHVPELGMLLATEVEG